ncbi:MAG: M61 family metallopeptidase [Ostreibacterium sp.]
MLHYTIKPKNLGGHLLSVTIDIPAGEKAIIAKLPKWIPGSYKIRDYSRHIQAFSALTNNQAILWQKIDSDTWKIAANEQAVTLTYDVYAYDLSVRGAYLDDKRLFFNHCCVCLDITHLSDEKRLIDIKTIRDWRIFTALPTENNQFYADNYAHQIDCPIESADQYLYSKFIVGGIIHEVVFTGAISDNYDLNGINKNLKKICTAEMQLFEGTPLDKYLFLTYLEPKQYGGLEHKNSVAQMASPDMMMTKNGKITDKIIDFMGLCSHEYFHLWNIKRLQPKDFQPYDLYHEQNTEMLWIFEGFTSYYDELFLLRASVVDATTFLKRQAKNLTRVLTVPGRHLQSLAASSFDAWTKLYQADAHSPNHIISYYSKGATFALYLDLFIRKHSHNKASLDDVMRFLWKNFGKKGIGIIEDDVFEACGQLIPTDKHTLLAVIFVEGIHGTNDLPIAEILTDFDVIYTACVAKTHEKENTCDSGIRLTIKNNTAKIAFLNSNSHAAKVGVSVEDTLIAINQQSLSVIDFKDYLHHSKPDDKLLLTLSRRGRVFEKTIQLTKPTANHISLAPTNNTNPLREAWLATWL